jgi:hypothetical protein
VADALALEPQAASPDTYRQRGASSLQRLFRSPFPEFAALYHTQYARRLGHSRLQRITQAVEHFLECGDYTKGVARIRCTNPDCRAEYFRPLYGEIARQVYAMILRFYNAAAGCSALKPPSPPKSPAQHGPG